MKLWILTLAQMVLVTLVYIVGYRTGCRQASIRATKVEKETDAVTALLDRLNAEAHQAGSRKDSADEDRRIREG